VLQLDNRDLFVIDRQMRVKRLGEKPPYVRWLPGQLAAIDSNHVVVSQFDWQSKPEQMKLIHVIDGKARIDTVPFLLGDQLGKRPMLQVLNKKVWYGLAGGIADEFLGDEYNVDRLVRTIDGGQTWEVPLNLRAHPEMGTWICDVKALDADNLYLLTTDKASEQHRFWKSTDSGKTWTLVNGDVFNNPTIQDILGNFLIIGDRFYCIDFWNAMNGIISITNEHIMRTNDGGVTWQFQRLYESAIKYTDQVHDSKQQFIQLLPNGHGHAIFTPDAQYEHPVMFSTADYGSTWTRHTMQVGGIWTVRVAPNHGAYLLPSKSGKLIYQSTKVGQSWDPFEFVQTAAPIGDMDFYSDTGGFALDRNGNVYRIRYPFVNRMDIR
jgi:photosystem II stability/assembly factor-like uncharacterized protein